MSNGIENLEWTVLPQGISKSIIPLDVVVNTISLFNLNATDIALKMYFFPVPPYPIEKICLI